MSRPLVPALALGLALLLSPVGVDATVLWTQITRNVGSEVIVTNTPEFAIDTDGDASSTSGLFLASASADTSLTGATGSSASEQDSDLTGTGFTGTGAFQTHTEVTVPEGFADVFGRSTFNGYFDLDVPTPYSLTGLLVNGGDGTSAQMFLFGPGGMIVDVQAFSGEVVPVDESGLLAPGSYLVSVNVAGNAQEAPPDLLTEASGEWEMSFVLGGTTAAPLTAPASALRVFPNPARGAATISRAARSESAGGPAEIRILDAAGRLVRSIATGTGARGAVTWDTRDAAGRPVPAGVYFVSVRNGDGRSETGRVTVLR